MSGTEAPEERPTLVTPSSQASSISLAKSTRYAAGTPACLATSTMRIEFEEFFEPTTITSSAWPASSLIAIWRFCVA